jgi:small conductance mechanosensitive channel
MFESVGARLVFIAILAVAAHLSVLMVRAGSRRMLRARLGSEAKVITITGFATSVIVFGIYFAAFGFLLSELGISLATYLASASVIGLAVSFGSQGVVQDVITGLTVVFSDLLDVGDMVDIGGQVGIVESVGMRFTVLVSFAGARIFVPNRSVANVINYPKGHVRAYLDARLPADPGACEAAERRAAELAQAAYDQYPGIILLPPTIEGRVGTRGGYDVLRIKFCIWPGQAAAFEGAVKPPLAHALRGLDPSYLDWMVSVHYRSEAPGEDASRRLPRPAALRRH